MIQSPPLPTVEREAIDRPGDRLEYLGPRRDLSPRELMVLRLLASGLSNKETALRLGISANTVRLHVSSILAKLQVSSRTQAAVWALKHGIAEG